jgi:colanic acid/amylovoran biosynthesis protein
LLNPRAEDTLDMSIVRRSVESITWNAAASVVQVLVGVVRSVLLARLLPVEVFGVYAMAGSIVSLSAVVAGLGMNEAFVHRAPETEDEDQAAAVWLALKLLFSSAWLVLLSAGSMRFAEGDNRVALLMLAIVQWGISITWVPQMILVRRVVHRRLAFIQLMNLLVSGAVAVALAWGGVGLWALLSTDILTLALSVFFLYLWRPVWSPHLAWSPSIVRYFLKFGSRNVVAEILLRALDRVDDLWTGAYLGKPSLGLYTRAYAFATYPRSILASAVNKVAGGTYAELAANRRQLSRAFFRTNAFLVRSGFLLAGLLGLVAPELIRLLLGTKWLPMLTAFRLMLAFTLFDPIKVTVAKLFVAVGRPEEVVRARAVQLAVMGIGLYTLGPRFGIAGVALAVDMMLVLGIALLLWQARKYVDFSLSTLFATPGLGLTAGMALGRAAITLPGVLGSPWRTGALKATVYVLTYSLTLLALERSQLLKMLSALPIGVLGQNQEVTQRDRTDERRTMQDSAMHDGKTIVAGPRIFLVGLTSAKLGGLESGNLGNYMIVEPLIEGLRAEFPCAAIRTSLQLSDEFCRRFDVTCLRRKRFWSYGWEAARATAIDIGRVSAWRLSKPFCEATADSLIEGSDLLSEIHAADLVIDFSGDIFGDNASYNKFLEGCAEILLARAMGKPVVMLAGSPGPFSGWRRVLGRFVLDRVSLVTNREPISTELLIALGIDQSRIENTACPSFLFEGKREDQIRTLLEEEGIDRQRPTVGLIVSGWNMPEGPFDRVPRQKWELTGFVRLVEFLLNDLGTQVVLISHSHRPDDKGGLTFGPDAKILEQIYGMVNAQDHGGSLILLSQPYDAATTKGILGTLDMLVSGRLHGAISGLSQGVPTVIIDYGYEPKAHKLRGVARLLNIERWICDPRDTQQMIRTAASAWTCRAQIRGQLVRDIEIIRDLAARNFAVLHGLHR